MATPHNHQTSNRVPSAVNAGPESSQAVGAYANGHNDTFHSDVNSNHGSHPPPPPPPAGSKKSGGKNKKPLDPSEVQNLVASKISQLETDKAGEREEEAEIGAYAVGPMRRYDN
jgi:hypothetical protein